MRKTRIRLGFCQNKKRHKENTSTWIFEYNWTSIKKIKNERRTKGMLLQLDSSLYDYFQYKTRTELTPSEVNTPINNPSLISVFHFNMCRWQTTCFSPHMQNKNSFPNLPPVTPSILHIWFQQKPACWNLTHLPRSLYMLSIYFSFEIVLLMILMLYSLLLVLW